jgi:TatD DNase family protein
MFIDSHAHLADAAFDADRDAVVRAAQAAGAAGLVCIGASEDAAAASRALAAAYPGLIAFTAGVHPHDAASYDAARDAMWIRHAVDAGAVAIGECGLDYHYDNAPRDRQRAAFDDQIGLAHDLGRPVVVHTRDAEDDTVAAIERAARLRVTGVLHCFTGTAKLAQAAVDAGWYVSFSGIVTFTKWTGDDIIRAVPDDRILAETDAPYLAPVPVRGRRNEPRFLPYTIARIAAARGTSPERVAALATGNARRLFGLASDGAAQV